MPVAKGWGMLIGKGLDETSSQSLGCCYDCEMGYPVLATLVNVSRLMGQALKHVC